MKNGDRGNSLLALHAIFSVVLNFAINHRYEEDTEHSQSEHVQPCIFISLLTSFKLLSR